MFGIVGCGSKSSKVSGTVSYKGTPIKSGMVTFMRADDGAVQNAYIVDGKYEFDNLPPGKVKVAVVLPGGNTPAAKGMDAKAAKRAIEKIGERPKQAPPDYKWPGSLTGGATEEGPSLPEKYADPNKSGVEYDVTPGTQTKNFDLS